MLRTIFRVTIVLLKEIDPELSFEWVENRAKHRANWAYQELKCFLTILRDERLDPLEIKGSYAGALGMPQFIPSSYLTFAFSPKGFEHLAFEQGRGDPEHCKLLKTQWMEKEYVLGEKEKNPVVL